MSATDRTIVTAFETGLPGGSGLSPGLRRCVGAAEAEEEAVSLVGAFGAFGNYLPEVRRSPARRCSRAAGKALMCVPHPDMQLESAAALGRLSLASGHVEDALSITEPAVERVRHKQIWGWRGMWLLSASRSLASRRRAVKVAVAGRAAVTGKITLRVTGHHKTRTIVARIKAGKVTLRLPKLAKGTYEGGPRFAAGEAAINASALRAFGWLAGDDELIALNWQHPAHRYSPAAQALTSAAPAVPVFPIGDYYVHMTEGFHVIGRVAQPALIALNQGGTSRSVAAAWGASEPDWWTADATLR